MWSFHTTGNFNSFFGLQKAHVRINRYHFIHCDASALDLNTAKLGRNFWSFFECSNIKRMLWKLVKVPQSADIYKTRIESQNQKILPFFIV